MSGRSALLLGVLLVAPLSLASTTTPGAQAPATASASRQSPALPHPETGRPLIRNFPPSEYGGGAQNWAFVQDRRGILYVGSANGILEYDSTSWRRIELPNRSTVRSLAQDSNGRIYAGGVSDFGYLDPDAT